MRPISVRKSLGQWEQEMVAAVADVAVPFLSFLRSSVAAFLLVSQTFAPCLTTSRHLSLSCTRYSWQLRLIPKDFIETLTVCLCRAFSGLLVESACFKTIRCRAVSSGGGDISCGQHDQSNKAVIASRWCRCWKEKPELKLQCQGCVFSIWCQESSSDRSCESGLASLYAIDKLSSFHSCKGGS